MKLSSKNGHPFMIFEIISRTVRAPSAARGALCGDYQTRIQPAEGLAAPSSHNLDGVCRETS